MNGLEALERIGGVRFVDYDNVFHTYKDRGNIKENYLYKEDYEKVKSELKASQILKEHLKVSDVIRDGNIVALGLESKDTQARIHIHLTEEEVTAIVEWLKGE